MNTEITNVRVIMPELVGATFINREQIIGCAQASHWGWTPLKGDFSQIMRGHFNNHQAGEWTDFGLGEDMENDAFGRYGLLNGMGNGEPQHTWTDMRGTLVIRRERPIHPPVDPDFIHIPSGWVKNMISAAQCGITRVTSVQINQEVRVYALVGHDAKGNKFEVLRNGGSGSGDFIYVAPSTWFRQFI